MCGRFFVDAKDREIDRLLEKLGAGAGEIKIGEIFPTNRALTISGGESGPAPEGMEWGFPKRDGKGVIFNARAETALEKPMFRSALLNNPIVAPATGFYEWTPNAAGGKDKYLFRAPDGSLLYLAGFGKIFPGAGKRFTLLTRDANDSVTPYHSRMPLILSRDETEAWLRGEDPAFFLKKTPAALLVIKS